MNIYSIKHDGIWTNTYKEPYMANDICYEAGDKGDLMRLFARSVRAVRATKGLKASQQLAVIDNLLKEVLGS
jgi:hypothetical protein